MAEHSTPARQRIIQMVEGESSDSLELIPIPDNMTFGPLEFSGGNNMFENECWEPIAWQESVDWEGGPAIMNENLGSYIEELGMERTREHINRGRSRIDDGAALNTSCSVPAAEHRSRSTAMASDYAEILNAMPGGSIGLGVNQTFTLQESDAAPWVLSVGPRPDNSAASQLPGLGAHLTHFGHHFPSLNGSQRARSMPSQADTTSTIDGFDTYSDAVFSTSSITDPATSLTSPERSRRGTTSTQDPRPGREVRTKIRFLNVSMDNVLPRSKQADCDVCGKKFPRLSDMRKHRKYHQGPGNRPHVCQHCSDVRRDFADASDLRRHIAKAHPGQFDGVVLQTWKRVVCECCGRSYSRRDIFLRHLPKKADTCGQYYQQKSEATVIPSSSMPSNAASAERHLTLQETDLEVAATPTKPTSRTGSKRNRSIVADPGRALEAVSLRLPPPLCPSMGDLSTPPHRSRSSLDPQVDVGEEADVYYW